MKRKLLSTIFVLIILTTLPITALARGGGGGSDSFDSSGDYTSFESSGNRSNSKEIDTNPIHKAITYSFPFLIIGFFIFAKIKKDKELKLKKELLDETLTEARKSGDMKWDVEKLNGVVNDIFLRFQKAWSEINIKEMNEILEVDFNKRIALELSVLNNEGRRNVMENIKIQVINIVGIQNKEGIDGDEFQAEITARADDKLIEIENSKVLFSDKSAFTETWNFIYQDNKWKLKAIHQATENILSLNIHISEFANNKGFYYNPDFGWLMLPNKGFLFSQSRFGNTDINNHVIGYYRDKIVEFYTMDIKIGNNTKESHLIAQVILPIKHNDILVRRKSLFQFTPKGMRKHELESNDFIKEYNVYSHPDDNITTFELLNPRFMEMITKLPFELNMEVVGNTLYLETSDISAGYEKMLEILSIAFDEMKM